MDELIYQKSYTEFREELRSELKRTAEGFVRIGYLLRVARDTDILKASGYSGLEDFARGEFDLDKTQVSRFIRINERFSEGGNSDKLMTGYADFGVRKLGLMLTLPDVINEELSPEYTVDEINSIKETYDEEKKVSPLEDYMEQQEAKAEEDKAAALAETDILSAVIYQIGHESPDLFKQMYESEDLIGDTDLFSVLAPGGEATHKVRIKGVGALLITCNDKTIAVTNMRSCIKQEYGWGDANNAFNSLIVTNVKAEVREAGEAWQQVYGEEYPAKPEVAPVQPKKESKVIDHTKKETPKEAQTPKTLLQEPVSEVPKSRVTDISKMNTPEELKESLYKPQNVETSDFMNAPEEEPEAEQEEPKAAVLEELENVTPDKVFECIERDHGKAAEIARYISNTLSYETEELDSGDIAELLERLKKLKMHLEGMKGSYEEYQKMVGAN